MPHACTASRTLVVSIAVRKAYRVCPSVQHPANTGVEIVCGVIKWLIRELTLQVQPETAATWRSRENTLLGERLPDIFSIGRPFPATRPLRIPQTLVVDSLT